MIEINLLPEELRKKDSPFSKLNLSALSMKSIPVLGIAIGLAGILIAVQVIVVAMGLYSRHTLDSLTKKYEALMPKKLEADALKAKNDIINSKSAAIDELMSRRFSWAKKLGVLSDSMTSGIWLTELNYDERPLSRPTALPRAGASSAPSLPGTLVLSGYAAGAGEQGAALVGRFIKSLKENEDFFSDFNQIELVSVKSDKVSEHEVMKFRIGCTFR